MERNKDRGIFTSGEKKLSLLRSSRILSNLIYIEAVSTCIIFELWIVGVKISPFSVDRIVASVITFMKSKSRCMNR